MKDGCKRTSKHACDKYQFSTDSIVDWTLSGAGLGFCLSSLAVAMDTIVNPKPSIKMGFVPFGAMCGGLMVGSFGAILNTYEAFRKRQYNDCIELRNKNWEENPKPQKSTSSTIKDKDDGGGSHPTL